MFYKYENLSLTILEEDKIEKYGHGYKYLIQNNAFAHTAFRTQEGLDRWLNLTGLKIGEQIKHLYNTYHILGSYVVRSILYDDGYGNFWNITDEERHIRELLLEPAKEGDSVWMSNGDYTKAYVEKTEAGNIIYYLNPNERKRIIYDRSIVPG